MAREKKNEREKECPLLAVCFTVVSPASFSTGMDYVKQRLMKPCGFRFIEQGRG
jgi:hypothetical protein